MTMRRALVEVRGIWASGVIELRVPSWNPHHSAFIPAAALPTELRDGLHRGSFLFAQVNLGAERACELVFSAFESAPEPVPEAELEEATMWGFARAGFGETLHLYGAQGGAACNRDKRLRGEYETLIERYADGSPVSRCSKCMARATKLSQKGKD